MTGREVAATLREISQLLQLKGENAFKVRAYELGADAFEALPADPAAPGGLYALVNEGARILEEGYALRAVDIDIIYLNGYGFPSYRGGPMWHADSVGLKKVYERICELREQHGELWEPAPLLRRLAEANQTFAEFNKDLVNA